MSAYTAQAYRRPLFDFADKLFSRCLRVSAACGLVLLAAIWLAPARRQVITHVAQLPERFARLILEEAKPVPPADLARPDEGPKAAAEPEPLAPEAPPAVPLPAPRARSSDARELPSDAGKIGRERAEAVRAELASTTASLQASLDDLSSSLQATRSESAVPSHGRRARGVRSGRSDADLPAIATGLGTSATADLGGSVVRGSRVAVGTLSSGTAALGDAGSGSSAASGRAATSGSAPGVYRSNASLLAVIQKYSAGIHYCYANELKHDESLRGKLVVAMTVAASGEVVEATVVENTLGSTRLAECALSQIRDWKFPPIEKGLTAFQAPFVFTPPK